MVLWIAIYLITFGAIIYVINNSIRGSRKGRLIDKIPGPYAWPIIGNIVEFLVPFENFWDLVHKINRDYYPINRMWTMNVPMVNIHHPDDLEIFLSSTKNISKSLAYDFLHPWLCTGLLTSKGAKWHERRKILTPAFHFNVLQQFVGIFAEQSEKLAQSVWSEGEEVIIDDLEALLHKFTLNAICETTMGSLFDLDEEVLEEYRSSVAEMNHIIVNRIMRPWLYLDWMFRWFRKFQDQNRVIKILHGFSNNLIDKRKKYHEETNGRHLEGLDSHSGFSLLRNVDNKPAGGKRRLAMLDLLISAQKEGANIDDEGIREEVDTFVFEGHDTTSAGLCFALLLLAENKEIQDRARSEVDAVFQAMKGEKLSLQDITGLTYIERCIKESLRLFPSVPLISRNVTEDVRFKNFVVPRGALVNIFISDTHRDPNFWTNPEVFDPDRFLPEQMQGRHPFSYVPFSAGPRNCIGQKFAMVEMKAFIGTFLHNFYFESMERSSEVKLTVDLVLRPMNRVRIKLIRRSQDK